MKLMKNLLTVAFAFGLIFTVGALSADAYVTMTDAPANHSGQEGGMISSCDSADWSCHGDDGVEGDVEGFDSSDPNQVCGKCHYEPYDPAKYPKEYHEKYYHDDGGIKQDESCGSDSAYGCHSSSLHGGETEGHSTSKDCGSCHAGAPNLESDDDDNDGLTDAEEEGLSSDPDNAADGDPTWDTPNTGEATDGLGTDPLDSDTDDDGFTDGFEVDHGMNPCVAETEIHFDKEVTDPEVYTSEPGTGTVSGHLPDDFDASLATPVVCAMPHQGTVVIDPATGEWTYTANGLGISTHHETYVGQDTFTIQYVNSAMEIVAYTVNVEMTSADGTTPPPADGTTPPPADGTTPPADGTTPPQGANTEPSGTNPETGGTGLIYFGTVAASTVGLTLLERRKRK